MTIVAAGADPAATAQGLLAVAASLDVDTALINVTTGPGGLQFDVPDAVAAAYADYTPPAPGGGAAGNALVAASTLTVTQMPDPLAGGDATMDVVVFPADYKARFAFAADGAEFPWMIMGGDWQDGVYFGDGTYDPYSDGGVNIYSNGEYAGRKSVAVGGVLTVNGPVILGGAGDDLTIQSHDKGVVLLSADNTPYRIRVANDGTLSTELVA